MAAAAGVHPSYVTINEVMTQGRRRRNLLQSDSIETIDVHASVLGAVKLRDLDKHLNRHSAKLHIAHRWEQAPQIRAVAIIPTGGRRTLPQVLQPVKPHPQPNLASSTSNNDKQKEEVRDRIKARSIKLVNKDLLQSMLNKI